VDVPATEAVLIKKEFRAEVLLDNRSLSGRVLSVNQKTDPYSSSVSLRIRMKNSDGAISPGSIVKTRIHYLEKESAVIIPKSALLEENKVFVLLGEKVQERTVRVGFENPEKVEILEGVKAGEKVIIEGNFGLYDNALVQEK
jgi:RND family efflux transporter MFP subunit